jgi:O-antigen/teichoic acid export membrane protein
MKRPLPDDMFVRSAMIAGARWFSGLELVVTAVIVSRALGPSGRGEYTLVVSVAWIAYLLVSLGVPLAARPRLAGPDGRYWLPRFLGLMGVLAVVQLFVCALAGSAALHAVDVDLSRIEMVEVGVAGAALLLADAAVVAAFFGGLTRYASLADAGGSTVGLLGAVALAAASVDSPGAYVWVAAGGWLAQAGFALGALRYRRLLPRPVADVDAWRTLMARGLRGLPLGASQAAAFRFDRYLLGAYAGATEVGLYAVAATAPEALRILPRTLGGLLTRQRAGGGLDDARGLRYRRWVLAATAALVVVAFAAAGALVSLVFGDEFAGAVTPLRILLAGEIAIAVYILATAELTARDRLASGSIASMIGFVAMVLLDVALIPRYDAAGAAWASLGAYWLMAWCAWVLARRAAAE